VIGEDRRAIINLMFIVRDCRTQLRHSSTRPSLNRPPSSQRVYHSEQRVQRTEIVTFRQLPTSYLQIRLFCFFFGHFCEKISQMRPSWKDFKKWTLSSAPWTAAPRLDATAPRITTLRWEAALPSWHDVAADVAPRVGALICGAEGPS
jgi:hypothetical protein